MCHTLEETELFKERNTSFFSSQEVPKSFEQKANHILTFGLRFYTIQNDKTKAQGSPFR